MECASGARAPIPLARLRAVPSARYCVECQDIEERRPAENSPERGVHAPMAKPKN